ncbi:MAG: CPBP family intramembrane metalloprotease [Chlamydiales bacterium]|nr:CPBP family intramembrane metalloprotease [Chlamydiales bacterium]
MISLIKQVPIGIACGTGQALFTFYPRKKIYDLTDVKYTDEYQQHIQDVFNATVKGPIIEECAFRGVLQPKITHLCASDFPQYARCPWIKIPYPNIMGIIFTAVVFGVLHESNYENGKIPAIGTHIFSGAIYGFLREKFGLVTSIFAHMAHNATVHKIDELVKKP